MRTKCYSVRLEFFTQISDKCYRATAFDGSEALIPAKFVFGKDATVHKCDAYWIAAWILERKELQYSVKKTAWFDSEDYADPYTPVYVKETKIHILNPEKIEPKENNFIKELEK